MKKVKAIFFDLDGTLAPLDEPLFVKMYMSLLAEKATKAGYDGKQFLAALGEGVKDMFANDGSVSNEEIFWVDILKHFPDIDKTIFDDFYRVDFLKTLVCVGENEYARKIVDYCKDNFEYVVLSTNPLFPKVATLLRMNKVGLKEDDFDFITSYENSSFCKPNPAYFTFLLEKFNLKPDEVIVFGNNDYEDCECAFKAGIKSYLIGDCLIHNDHCQMKFEHLEMNKVIDFLSNLNKEIA